MSRKKSEFLGALGKLFEIFRLFMNDMLEQGGSDEDVERILTDATLRQKMVGLVVGERSSGQRDFQIWKALQLGTGLRTADGFRKALKQANCQIGEWANDILGQSAFTASVSLTEQQVNLVIRSVAELGFKNGARYDQICARATELGLELCPAEVGPQLRLQYADQPLGEWLVIAMEPISGSDGNLRLFGVRRGGDGLWLDGRYGDPGRFWYGSSRFVFVSRK